MANSPVLTSTPTPRQPSPLATGAIAGPSGAAVGAPLRVAVLHNYRDEAQPSMRLYADRLGDALVRAGMSVTRVRPPNVVPDAWRARSSTWAKIDGYVGRFAVYPRLVRRLSADIVHVIDHGQGYLLASLNVARVVVTCHDVILLALASGRIGSTRVPPVALQLFRISLELMKRAAAIVAVSQQTKNDLVSFLNIAPSRITVIPPGLNQAFGPDPERGQQLRQRFRLGDGPLILQIGRTFYKNIPGVLRVVHKLRAEGLPVRLVRTGRALSGEDRALGQRLGILDAVVELGAIADAELPALYNAVDLLLFPSLYEGFGWPPLEAMASGTPVVCSRAGALDEVVGQAALTADPEDIGMLSWHAGTILGSPTLRASLIARGQAQAAHYRWDRTARELVAVYRHVAEAAA